jgi:hypothetical protein
LISSYKLKLKKVDKIKLRRYLTSNIKQSKFTDYPNRAPLKRGYICVKHRNQTTKIPISHNNALLNRVRTGHSRARIQLKNIGMESEDLCRHCNRHPETIEHQLIKCKKFKKRLKKFRRQYTQMGITDFNEPYKSNSWPTFFQQHMNTDAIYNGEEYKLACQ